MDDKKDEKPAEEEPKEDSLESPSTEAGTDSDTIDATSDGGKDSESKPAKKPGILKRVFGRSNIYLVLMFVVLMVALLVVIVMYMMSAKASTAGGGSTSTVSSTSLSEATLQQLSNGNATVGSANEILNVQSNTIFSSKVLMKQDLDIAGNLEIGQGLTLNDISVAGTAQVGQLNVGKDVAITGDENLQGALNVGKTLQVSGGGTFNGTLSAPTVSTSNLDLTGNLAISHHVTTSGGTPNKTNGPALGGGGSASVSGDDTSGDVSINTGGSTVAGCFVSIAFTSSFATVPNVIATPVGVDAGGLAYYITKTATGFSICDSTAAPAGSSFSFDYIVLD
jgi:hypothetical protein